MISTAQWANVIHNKLFIIYNLKLPYALLKPIYIIGKVIAIRKPTTKAKYKNLFFALNWKIINTGIDIKA